MGDINSPNWREFENLVCDMEQVRRKGWLDNSTIIIATDNHVVGSALYNGSSSSIKLYNLVVRLKMVDMRYGVQLVVTRVSGKRMQAHGTNGVSRGCLNTGVAIGRDMIEFCQWRKDPSEVAPELKSWIKSWAGEEIICLSPRDWYVR